MSLTKDFFKQPGFRNNVLVTFHDSGAEIHYRDQGCSIDIAPEFRRETAQLLQLLQMGGIPQEQLGWNCPGIQEQIPKLLIEFDGLGLLTETQSTVTFGSVSGRQFYRDLYRFVERMKGRVANSAYYQGMVDGTVTRNQLIGYVLEYYHIVHLCPSMLAPSLANHESRTTREFLQQFFVSELHHDRIIEESLKSVGFERDQLERMQPLPMTFALCSTLGVFAKQHPLSFKAALFLFEQPYKKFNEAFEKLCKALDIPSEFYEPILLHACINEEGEHEQISKVLLGEVPCVSLEEQLVVKKHIGILVESMVLQEQQILDYYGNQQNIIPRCFT
ncbi:iron-containing redox enzyme family protein [Nostoc sp. CHAB 5784]|uniref:iron-containing redox enzyme family protein n=1 Tax=Nostoc mirabile TaxID=2907820 RepID=UPI001E3ECD57|nr:iron-containing redox enzyme family protein [Nostoc mirabile]MCC5662405.1 iron-containing redox enzyme family protein [Nostoc mirabile CHAB5784]